MKKFLLSAAVIFGFGAYVLFSRNASQLAVTPPAVIEQKNNAAVVPPAGSNQQKTMGMSGQGMGMMNQGLYKNGVYTGSVADAYYGPLQVKVIIQGGKIADVQFLQYPQDRSTSVRINTEAMPYLKSEAIQAQSAQVDIVSGATQTSQAFVETLGSALAQSKI